MLTSLLGIRMLVWMGKTIAVPPPSEVVESLISARVITDVDEGNGFELTFAIGKDSVTDFGLLGSGVIDPMNRVIIGVILGAVPTVLIDGVITHHEMTPSDRPGQSTLTVKGRDVTLLMDLEEKNETFANMPDNLIVQQIGLKYAQYGLQVLATPTLRMPIDLFWTPQQNDTDLGYIQTLAERNGYVFYVEPLFFKVNLAYFGPDTRVTVPLPALQIDRGASTNLTSLTFSNDALAAIEASGSFIETLSMSVVPIPSAPSLRLPPLSSKPSSAQRKVLLRESANLDPAGAVVSSMAAVSGAPDAVRAEGQVDCVRYGAALRTRRRVGIAGAGKTYDGDYIVSSVTHELTPHGSYTQSFVAKREGTGAQLPVVVTI